MYLLVDDTKNISADIIARTVGAAKLILENCHTQITCLGIDFDLGYGWSGNDLIKWAIKNNYLPKQVQVVSLSPVGKTAINDTLLNDAKYTTVDRINYKKN